MKSKIRDVLDRAVGNFVTPYIILIITLIFLLFPLYWMFVTAFKPSTEIFQWPPTLFPVNFTLSNFIHVLLLTPVPTFIMNSVLYSLCATAIVLSSGVLAAYALSIYPFKHSEKVSFTYFATRVIPPQVLWLPFMIVFMQLRLNDSRIAVILFETMLVYPLCLLMLKNLFDNFPQDLVDAASIDGCSRLQILWSVVLPIMAPGIAAVAIIAFLWSWNEFMFPFLILNSRSLYPITVGVYYFVGDEGIQWGMMSAAGVLAILPGLLFFTVAQRHIVSGLTQGAIKE